MSNPKGKGFFQEFDWKLYPNTEKFLQRQVSVFLKNNKTANALSKKMQANASTRFFDWIDHIVLPLQKFSAKKLESLGFEQDKASLSEGSLVFRHPQSVFFPVILSPQNVHEVCIKTEQISGLAKVFGKQKQIQGKSFSPIQKLEVFAQKNFVLTAIQRNGSSGFVVEQNSSDIANYKNALKVFSLRKRFFSSDKKGMVFTKKLVKKILAGLSPSRTADAFFRAERIYWQKKNHAGKVQKKRQDSLGLGWGNHDHHTYRSSRENFSLLIEIFESMGFVCRESFHAGEKAGWGAQILEHPQCDIVVFADLDLSVKEKGTNFAHKKLLPLKSLGTVGLWIGLHGESILQAGMHHLEARFDFKALSQSLPKKGINVMKPFSDFSFLKQAFTQGETWAVDKKCAQKLLGKKLITREQFDKFVKQGAIGSHLENLQRTQGFKGFNQNSVSAIIKATDPRKEVHHKGA